MNYYNSQEYFEEEQIPSENRPAYPIEFPVDISRDEFVRFNMIVSKIGGVMRFQKGQIILIAVISVICIFMFISDLISYNKIDPINVMLMIFLISSGAIMVFGFSSRVKNAAENTYDLTQQSGQSYYGIISIYPDRIEKRNDDKLVSINLSQAALYIETQDMIIITAQQKPAIVLPSRCLTPSDAEAVRSVIFGAVPVTRQKIESRFIPAAERHISQPESNSIEQDFDDQNAIIVNVNYTREEFVKMANDSALRNYLKMLPLYSVMSLITSISIGFLYNFGAGIAVYIIFNAGLIGLNLFNSRTRSGRIYDSMPQNASQINAYFTQSGINIKSQGRSGTVMIKWNSITRAVDRPESFDFYSNSLFIRIPKRCVSDINELKEFINNNYSGSKEK
jgi:hypothetical protein